MTPYKILGIGEQASDEEVKRAYHAKAAKHHPDAGGDAWAFEQVRAAYEQIMAARQARATQGTQASQSPPTSDMPMEKPSPVPSELPSNWLVRLLKGAISRELPLQTETSFFILANVLDIVMTNILLRFNAMEANPLAKLVLEHWGFRGMIAFKMLIVAMVCVIAQIVAIRNLTRAKQLLYVGCGIVGLVVVYSAALLFMTRH